MPQKHLFSFVLLILVTAAGPALAQSGFGQLAASRPVVAQPFPDKPPRPASIWSNGHNTTEMIGGLFGFGLAGGEPAVASGIRVVTLRWNRFAWTIFDAFVASGISDFQLIEENRECSPVVQGCTIDAETGLAHFGTRLYYKLDRDTGQRQLWWGLGIGVLTEDSNAGNETEGNSAGRFSVSPSVDYVWQWTDSITVGLGARVAVGLGDRFDTGRLPFMMLLSVEVGITPWPAIRRQIVNGMVGNS